MIDQALVFSVLPDKIYRCQPAVEDAVRLYGIAMPASGHKVIRPIIPRAAKWAEMIEMGRVYNIEFNPAVETPSILRFHYCLLGR